MQWEYIYLYLCFIHQEFLYLEQFLMANKKSRLNNHMPRDLKSTTSKQTALTPLDIGFLVNLYLNPSEVPKMIRFHWAKNVVRRIKTHF